VQRTINCPACGTKTDARRRTRCPRCRAQLTPPRAPEPVAKRSRTPLAVACVVGLIITAGVVIQIGTTGESLPTASAAAANAATSPSAAATHSRATGEHEPSAVVTSMDLSRGGLAAYSKGDVSGSIEQFTAAAQADPSNAQTLNNLGQALVRAGRAREAIPHFDRAVAAEGSVWTYHFNRARAYGELREWGSAIAGYREAARLFPEDYATAFNLARALQANGDLNGAIEEFGRAINLAPGEAEFPLALASTLEAARRPADAVRAYEWFLELQDSGQTAEKVRERIEALKLN